MLDTFRAKLQGFKTFIAAGAVGLVGVANAVGALDITPLVRYFVADEHVVGVVMVLIAILFGALRYVTTTPPVVEGELPPEQFAPIKAGVDAGD